MDQKEWLRRKRSLENSIAANNEAEISIKGNQEEKLPYEKEAALGRTIKDVHEKVVSLLSECNAKDELMARHAKTVQEANTGREKVRKQEPENALHQTVAANERLVRLNAALKDCRQQPSSLESKYVEARKKLVNLTVENARLTKALITKEEIIEDVNNQMAQATAEFNELISRLDSTERGNDVLKYECRLLERELKIRNRCADVENRKNQESAKRVAKLEAERHRLRLLARKWIPGHAKTKPSNHPKAVDRRISLMIKRLCEVEEENKILIESACKRENEICLPKTERARMRCDERNISIAMQYKVIGDSGMSLKDDCDEMEKLAIVSVDAHSSNKVEMVGKELVQVPQRVAFNSSEKDYDWLQGVLKEILEQNYASKRSFDELLEDIRIALRCRYHSSSMGENEGVINKSNEVKPVHEDLEAKLLESENNIVALKTELEYLKELKRMTEDHVENLKLINVDLDHQLSVAKVQITEALQKVSYLEMELEVKSHRCEELEATSLDLQLQLASISVKDVVYEYVGQEEKLLQTGLETTAELTNNKKATQRYSLYDHMATEDGVDMEDLLNPSMTKEIISTTKKEPSALRSNTCNNSYGLKNAIPRALAVVPSKKHGKGTELLKKLLS